MFVIVNVHLWVGCEEARTPHCVGGVWGRRSAAWQESRLNWSLNVIQVVNHMHRPLAECERER